MPAVNPNIVFRAFADLTRLRILNVLRQGEICVGDLVEIIKAPQPTISRHLGHLRSAGLVTVEREGNWCFYSLADPISTLHARLLECLGCCLTDAPQLHRDLQRLERLQSRGGCCDRDIAPTTSNKNACGTRCK